MSAIIGCLADSIHIPFPPRTFKHTNLPFPTKLRETIIHALAHKLRGPIWHEIGLHGACDVQDSWVYICGMLSEEAVEQD